MRRLWSCVILAVVALLVFSTASVGAGGKKSYSLTDSGTNYTDCSFQPRFEWTNYPERATYTIRVWILYDGAYVPHPQYPNQHFMDWTSTTTLGTGTYGVGAGTGASTSAHTITYRATLTKNGTNPRLLVDTSLVYTDMYCNNVAS